MNKHLNAIRKAGFSSLFTPTKAIRRVRAIAADRTRASLTGGCSGAGNFRIYTEFCSAEGEPGRLGNRAGQRPLPKGLWDRRGQGSRVTARGVPRRASPAGAFAGGLVQSQSMMETHLLLRNPPVLAKRAASKTASSRISRRDRRGAHATVKEVLTRAIAASQHWRIIRSGVAQHF